jgi:hypothetical protein
MTTRETIRAWLREGVEMGATHVIVAHDSFDGSDHPAFVMLGENRLRRDVQVAPMRTAASWKCMRSTWTSKSSLRDWRCSGINLREST